MIDLASAWPYVKFVACERLKHNKTPRHVSQFGEAIETMGAAGELAARRHFGLPDQLGTRFDGGSDFVYLAHTYDIKATMWTRKVQFRFLQWPVWKPIKADIILLTAVDAERKRAILLGYTTRLEIMTAQINSTRFYPCHEIPIQNLHPVIELMPPAPKPMRISDRTAIKDAIHRDGVCLYGLYMREDCSKGLDPHHIITRGAGGDDEPHNIITLCRRHHQLAQTNVIKVKALREILSIYYQYTYSEAVIWTKTI